MMVVSLYWWRTQEYPEKTREYNSTIITLQTKDMANFIHVVVKFVFSDRYFDLNLNAVIIKLHEEASHC
jgi:hypothetical protein